MGNSCSNQVSSVADRYEVPQVSEVNVLCFNMFVRPPFINNNGDDYKDERLEEFVKIMGNYDVICLQEMFEVYSQRKQVLIEIAIELGFLFHATSPKPVTLSSHYIDAGLLVLSRFPITDFEFCPYPRGFGVDYYVQKGILYAKIQIGSSYLHIFNTHTQANYEPDISCLLKKAEQFTLFQQFVKNTLSKYEYCGDDMVLLAGDLNVNARTKVMYESDAFFSNPLFQKLSILKKSSHFHEYDALLGLLSDDHRDELEDLLYVDCGEHPTTFGDSELDKNHKQKPIDTVLTHKNNFCSHQRLDYIFRYVPKTLPESPSPSQGGKNPGNVKLSVKKGSTVVEKFFVEGHPFCQLSDHYGVKLSLLCENKDEVKIPSSEHIRNDINHHENISSYVKPRQLEDLSS